MLFGTRRYMLMGALAGLVTVTAVAAYGLVVRTPSISSGGDVSPDGVVTVVGGFAPGWSTGAGIALHAGAVPCWVAPRPGDADADGDVDQDDYAGLYLCLSGPDVLPSGECGPFYLDEDDDIDLVDVRAFQVAFTGAEE